MFFGGLHKTRVAKGSPSNRVRVNQFDQLECDGCRGLYTLFEQDNVRRQRRTDTNNAPLPPRSLHMSFHELDECATKRGCVACQVFRRALLLEQMTSESHYELVDGSLHGAVEVSLRFRDTLRWLEVSVKTEAEAFKAVVVLSTADILRQYPRAHVEYGQPLNLQRLTRLKSWISNCHREHPCANFKYSQRNPTWLLRILPQNKIQLVSGDGGGDNNHGLMKYVALSYCWGDEVSIKASEPKAWARVMQGYTTDVEARRVPFPATDLPETLQDAVAITYSLGVEYIWIDSVCVPPGFWHNEANRMHEVYGNAHFTLSSSGTTKAIDRMLVAQDAWRDASRGCRLYEPWLLNTDMPLDEMRSRSPVADRGWILQEERLSPRILYWCPQRAYWSCTECQRIEAKQPGGISQPRQDAIVRLSHPQRFMQVCRSGDTAAMKAEWCDIVASYCRRSLSDVKLAENRFAALSGLAVRYLSASSTSVSRDEYLAGLWRKNIAQNLVWIAKTAMSPSEHLRHAAPSWSWLSLPLRSEMEMPAIVEASQFFQILTERQVTDVDTDQDIVRRGAGLKLLDVSGRFRPLITNIHTARVPWDALERVQQPGSFNFSHDPAQPVYARNEAGKLVVYEPHKDEIMCQLDYSARDADGESPRHGERSANTNESSPSEGASLGHERSSPGVDEGLERHLYCLEIGTQAMLLLEPVSTENTDFRRVGVSLQCRERFFDGAAVKQIRLV